MDWQTILSVVAIGVAAITLLAKFLDNSLSVREHEEFRRGFERTTDGLKDDFQRQLDRIDRRIDVIEQTRPTAGELKITAENMHDHIDKLEQK